MWSSGLHCMSGVEVWNTFCHIHCRAIRWRPLRRFVYTSCYLFVVFHLITDFDVSWISSLVGCERVSFLKPIVSINKTVAIPRNNLKTLFNSSRVHFGFIVTASYSCTLKFVVKDCDPATGEPDDEEGYDDEYVVSIISQEECYFLCCETCTRSKDVSIAFKCNFLTPKI